MAISKSTQSKKAVKSIASKKPTEEISKKASATEVQRVFMGFVRRYKDVLIEAVSNDYLLSQLVSDWTKYSVYGCVVDAVARNFSELSVAVTKRDMVAVKNILIQLDGTSPTSPPYTPTESAWD